mgnify:CR=1 FL=1
MSVSLAKTTYSVQNGKSKVRTKEYATPRNAMKFGAPSLPTGEHSIISTTGGKDTLLVTFHKA